MALSVWHVHFMAAEKRYVFPTDTPRRDRWELGVQICRRGENGGHYVVNDYVVGFYEFLQQLDGASYYSLLSVAVSCCSASYSSDFAHKDFT